MELQLKIFIAMLNMDGHLKFGDQLQMLKLLVLTLFSLYVVLVNLTLNLLPVLFKLPFLMVLMLVSKKVELLLIH
jgi:hypothetical protein